MSTIVDFGFFKPVVQEDSPEDPIVWGAIVFYVNEDGQDWYDLRKPLTEWDENNGRYLSAVYGCWLLVDADGVVTNVEYDPAKLAPLERRILAVDCHWKDITQGMLYRDGKLVHPPQEATA